VILWLVVWICVLVLVLGFFRRWCGLIWFLHVCLSFCLLVRFCFWVLCLIIFFLICDFSHPTHPFCKVRPTIHPMGSRRNPVMFCTTPGFLSLCYWVTCDCFCLVVSHQNHYCSAFSKTCCYWWWSTILGFVWPRVFPMMVANHWICVAYYGLLQHVFWFCMLSFTVFYADYGC